MININILFQLKILKCHFAKVVILRVTLKIPSIQIPNSNFMGICHFLNYNIIILIPPTITIVANRCHNQHHNSATATIFIATHCHHHYSYTLSSPLPSTFITTTTIITKSLPQWYNSSFTSIISNILIIKNTNLYWKD